MSARTSFVANRKFVSRSINALKDSDRRVAGGFASDFLKADRGTVEQFQRSSNSFEETAPRRNFGCLCRTARPPLRDFGHG